VLVAAAIIQAVATLVLVGITAWYVWITHRILVDTAKARAQELAPYVVAFFDTPEDTWVDLVVKNVGKTPAFDVKITLKPTTLTLDQIPFVRSTSPAIPPNYEIRAYVSMLKSYLDSGDPLTIEAEVSYRGEAGESPTVVKHVLDLSIHKNRVSVSRKGIQDVAESLKTINKTLDAIAKK
jgi:hypothetical protein